MNKAEVLQQSRLFEGLLPEELELLAEVIQQEDFEAGDVVFEQGEVGEALYLLAEGTIDVIRKMDAGKQHVIATLSAPDFFGEMSLIDKEYRSATIRAKTDAVLLSLTNKNLHSFARVYKNGFTLVVINIARVMSARLRETNAKLAAKM